MTLYDPQFLTNCKDRKETLSYIDTGKGEKVKISKRSAMRRIDTTNAT